MLYDLNVGWSPSMTQEDLVQILSLASSLGYGTVALNHMLAQSPRPDHTAPFPDLSSLHNMTTADDAGEKQQQQQHTVKLPNILHRATIPLSDPSASTYRLPALARVYDLLAVRPATADAFQNACLTLDVPLISLDLTQHFPFHFRPKPCMTAVARGVRFEVCYAQVIGGTAPVDARSRAHFIANLTSLVRATRGRGIVISSEAKTALSLRPPADVVNLLNVWGLGREQGMEGIRSIPRSVVANEGLKRTGFKGVVDVVQVAKKNPSAAAGEAEGKGPQPGQGGKKKQKQKRKNGEAAEAPPGGDLRQNKKMKLVTRDSNNKGQGD